MRPFLDDAAHWLCICSARLLELDTSGRKRVDCEALATELYQVEIYRRMDPVDAAEEHVRAHWARVAA